MNLIITTNRILKSGKLSAKMLEWSDITDVELKTFFGAFNIEECGSLCGQVTLRAMLVGPLKVDRSKHRGQRKSGPLSSSLWFEVWG